jgi:hypothetical protein
MKSTKIIIAFVISLCLLFSSCNNSTQPKEAKESTTAVKSGHDVKVYQCPMDPHIIKNEAGKCPVCGMDLEQKTYHEALMFLANFKKENADYHEGDSLLKGMGDMDMK